MKLPETIQRLDQNASAMGHAVQQMLNQVSGSQTAVHFVLLYHVDGITQFVSNMPRDLILSKLYEMKERIEAGDDKVAEFFNPKGFNS